MAISQNYLNLLLNQLWQAGYFSYTMPAPLLAQFVSGIETAANISLAGKKLQGFISPDTSPRLLLTEHDALAQTGYAIAYFDDLRTCITDGVTAGEVAPPGSVIIEFRLGAFMPAHLGFGLPPAPGSGNLLDIMRVNPNAVGSRPPERSFDIYYDLANITLNPSVQSVAGLGTLAAKVTDAALPALQGEFQSVISGMLATNDAAFIPTLPNTPITQQYYPFSSVSANSNATQANWFVTQMLVSRGNLYVQFGLASPLFALNIATLTCAQAQQIFKSDLSGIASPK